MKFLPTIFSIAAYLTLQIFAAESSDKFEEAHTFIALISERIFSDGYYYIKTQRSAGQLSGGSSLLQNLTLFKLGFDLDEGCVLKDTLIPDIMQIIQNAALDSNSVSALVNEENCALSLDLPRIPNIHEAVNLLKKYKKIINYVQLECNSKYCSEDFQKITGFLIENNIPFSLIFSGFSLPFSRLIEYFGQSLEFLQTPLLRECTFNGFGHKLEKAMYEAIAKRTVSLDRFIMNASFRVFKKEIASVLKANKEISSLHLLYESRPIRSLPVELLEAVKELKNLKEFTINTRDFSTKCLEQVLLICENISHVKLQDYSAELIPFLVVLKSFEQIETFSVDLTLGSNDLEKHLSLIKEIKQLPFKSVEIFDSCNFSARAPVFGPLLQLMPHLKSLSLPLDGWRTNSHMLLPFLSVLSNLHCLTLHGSFYMTLLDLSDFIDEMVLPAKVTTVFLSQTTFPNPIKADLAMLKAKIFTKFPNLVLFLLHDISFTRFR